MRSYLFLILLLCCYCTADAQLMGSSANGHSPGKEVAPGSVSAGGIGGDVNLFTGTYNSTYALGSVSTPSGLSYTASLSYNSTFAAGDNLPQSSGIPYGEGWNLDVPILSISTEDYNKYTIANIHSMGSGDGACSSSGQAYIGECGGNTPSPTSIFNANDCEDAREEGRLYWFAPTISIPGVVSGRLVYKEQDGSDFVFVLHKFERYVEARLRKDGPNDKEHWVIILDDGTQYEMRAMTVSHRNPSNQRVQSDCDDLATLRNLLLPKSEILTWHCERITHPNKAGEITFTYEKLGEFQFFGIINQHLTESSSGRIYQHFYDGGPIKRRLEAGFKDILLTEINSNYEKLILDYNNILGDDFQPELLAKGEGLIHPDDQMQKDNMYGSVVEKVWNSDFTDWHRYLHQMGTLTNGYRGAEYATQQMRSLNPYAGKRDLDTGFKYEREAITNSGDVAFSERDLNDEGSFHAGYLQSPRIGGYNSNVTIYPGELYEVSLGVTDPTHSDAILDVNIATGDYDPSFNGGTGNRRYANCYNKQHGESIYSTFGQGFKWWNQVGTLSNLFVMPNLPNQYNGFNIQVGPANSDTDFNTSLTTQNFSTFSEPGTCNSYITHNTPPCDETSNNSPLMRSGQNVPSNFGVGLPWKSLVDFYEDSELLKPCTDGDNFWFNDESAVYQWDNQPTGVWEDIKLRNASLIRHLKNPYMLTSVQFQVKNKNGGWAATRGIAMEYDVTKVRRFVNAISNYPCTPTADSYATDTYRNVFLLTGIREMPNGGTVFSDAPNAPTTRLEYSDCGLWPGNTPFNIPFLGQGYQVHNTNFSALKKITDPLGKVTTLDYHPLDDSAPNTPILGANQSYNLLKLGYSWRPNPGKSSGFSNDGPCTGTVVKRSDPYAYQTYLVVKEKTVENENGVLTWTYDFQSPTLMNNFPHINAQFAWDKNLNITAGFGQATVTGPTSQGSAPSALYVHDTDPLYWGKMTDILSYDANGTATNRQKISYDKVLAFDKPWQYPGNAHPDFIPTDRMFDVPYFYETDSATLIENHNSKYLKSYFIKKTKEESWTYAANGESIKVSTTDFDYYDQVPSLGYDVMGVTSIDPNIEPSFQLYKTKTYSEDYGGAGGAFTETEHFYLYDLLHLGQYTTGSSPIFQRVFDNKMRSLPFQTRTTTKSMNDVARTQSSFQLYTGEVANRILLKNTALQVENAVGGLVSFSGASMVPSFPVEVLITQTILDWNQFGQPKLTEDVKGLLTEYTHYNNGLLHHQISGLGEQYELRSDFRYYNNNRLWISYNPNLEQTRYNYDGYGRLTQIYRNNRLINSYTYGNWDGITSNFFEKAKQNFVSTTNHTEGTGGWTNISFLDPLNRNIANVEAGVMRDYKVYDDWGRPVVQHKPISYGGTLNITIPSNQAVDHSEFEYEAAPRSEVVKSSKLGESISGAHIVEVDYTIVSAGELINELIAANQWAQPPGSLFFRAQTTDEDGKTSIQFTNPANQLVASIVNNGTAGLVYYYDSQGNVKKFINAKDQETEYKYNYMGQLYQKLTVDAATTNYGYDEAGLLVAAQDGNARRVYDFDIFGRMISQARAQSLNGLLDNMGMAWVGNLKAFRNNHKAIVDAAATNLEKEFFYNTYNANKWGTYPLNAQEYLTHSLDQTRGRLVQTTSYDMDGVEIDHKFLSYTSDGFIKWEMENFKGAAQAKGLLVRMDYPSYNNQGSPLKQNIDLNGDHTLDFQYQYTYDNQNRIEEVFVSYDDPDSGGGYKVVDYTYDDVKGAVKFKRHYASGINGCLDQEVDLFSYAYDSRHRLKGSSSNFFTQELYYDGDHDGSFTNGATDSYNGNINTSSASYTLANTTNAPIGIFDGATIYNYTYDNQNRLTDAKARVIMDSGAPPVTDFGTTAYSYDKIGNLLTLQRFKLNTNNVLMQEHYNYLYNGGTNTLRRIQHLAQSLPDREFAFDSNGNLSTDTGKDILNTVYGRANLPGRISKSDQVIDYLYDGDDSRIFKRTNNGDEFYIRTASGQDVAIFDMTNDNLTWYVQGNERVAKIFNQTVLEFTEAAADDGLEPCVIDPRGNTPHIPTPGRDFCNDRTKYAELEAFSNLHDEMLQTRSERLSYPLKIKRISVCEGRQINVLEHELAAVAISYEELQTITISSPRQLFSLELCTGQFLHNITMSEMLDTRKKDEVVIINRWEVPTTPTPPSDPFDCDLTEIENPPIPSPGFYVYDHLNNTRVHYGVACTGDLITYTLNHVADYYPYGKILREYVSGEQEKYLTTLHERDVETGLDYRGARFYDSDIGRFLSLDPLAANYPEWSDYNYVLGNPIRFVDPDGRSPEETDPYVIEAEVVVMRDGHQLGTADVKIKFDYSDKIKKFDLSTAKVEVTITSNEGTLSKVEGSYSGGVLTITFTEKVVSKSVKTGSADSKKETTNPPSIEITKGPVQGGGGFKETETIKETNTENTASTETQESFSLKQNIALTSGSAVSRYVEGYGFMASHPAQVYHYKVGSTETRGVGITGDVIMEDNPIQRDGRRMSAESYRKVRESRRKSGRTTSPRKSGRTSSLRGNN